MSPAVWSVLLSDTAQEVVVTVLRLLVTLWRKLTGQCKAVQPFEASVWNREWSEFLRCTVGFYRRLPESDRRTFEKRCYLFLSTTSVEGGGGAEVTDEDRLLVAASAIIPVWGFPEWHYLNIKTVVLLPSAFNEEFICGGRDARISGMVGTGVMSGKMVLSKADLHYGFRNDSDKQNVGIHEFAHLVDMADGDCDGFPERLQEYRACAQWFEFVHFKISEIEKRKSNIRQYGATNPQEFFAVSSEYFFERPKMMKKKHPELYQYLSDFYRQNLAEIRDEVTPSLNKPCLCGSGKKYKRCCAPAA